VTLGGLAGLALLAAFQQGSRGALAGADLRIAVSGTEAVVEAEYVVAGAGSLELLVLRMKGQTIALEHAVLDGQPLMVEEMEAAIRLRAAGPPHGGAVRVRYRLAGRLARIPLFVPSAPTQPPSRAVRITVTGLEAGRAAVHTAPRFTRDPGGAFVARGEHVPSMVALVADPAELPVPRIAELVVIAVAIGGTGLWVARLARGRRREPVRR